MKIYVSSTFEDLREHRAALDTALRRMGHDVIGMEHYVAQGSTPLEQCLADVRSADVYIVVAAWRYGYVPQDPSANPCCRSITELEYEAAAGSGKSILAFLLDPTAPWPPSSMDAQSERGGSEIVRFRSLLGGRHLAGIFRSPDNLASLAAPAVAVQGMSRHMAERALKLDQVSSVMNPFVTGSDLHDTTLDAIRQMVSNAGTTRALIIDMGTGNTWWSTRLYLLATLLHSLTSVRQLVFADSRGHFAGMASPAAVREGLRHSCDRDLRYRARSSYSPSVSGVIRLAWLLVSYPVGSRLGGSQAWPPKRSRRASSLLMPHLAAVDR